MEKITVLFAAVSAIVAMLMLQACLGMARTAGTQCARPMLTPSDASSATTSVTVTIRTATAGAYLRYTLDGSTPTGGASGNGTEIAASNGKVFFTLGPKEKTLKAIAYKAGLTDSSIAEANYVYASPYWEESKSGLVMRVYDERGNVIEPHEYKGDFKERQHEKNICAYAVGL